MATSGSVDFSVSRANLITDALMLVGAIGPDDTPSTNQITHAARQLNMLVKSWQGKIGIGLWARKTGYILPINDTNQVLLGPSGGHATTSYVQTTLTSDASSTVISVDSATGIVDTYYIGVELDDGDMHWTTVSGTPSGTTVNLSVSLPSTASEGNYVYCYQTKMQRPIHVLNAYRTNLPSSSDVEISVVAKADYDRLGMKSNEGTVNQLVYDPQLDNGVAYFYPRFIDGKNIITIIFQRPFEDFDAANDTPDFPQNWYLALCYALAVILAPTYGLPVQDRAALKAEAKEAFMDAEDTEPEDGSFQFQPERR